jgi:hypothetical protein
MNDQKKPIVDKRRALLYPADAVVLLLDHQAGGFDENCAVISDGLLRPKLHC